MRLGSRGVKRYFSSGSGKNGPGPANDQDGEYPRFSASWMDRGQPELEGSPRKGRCGMTLSRRFCVRTYGCQMNAHDSEKLANLLLHHGYTPTGTPEDADLLLINTCSIRDKAEQQLYSDLGA